MTYVQTPGQTGGVEPTPPQWGQQQQWNQQGFRAPYIQQPVRYRRAPKRRGPILWALLVAVLVVGLVTTGVVVTGHRGGSSTAVSSGMQDGYDLGELWDSIKDPCPLGQTAYQIVTVPPAGVVDKYWPDEADVRAKVAAVHTPSHDGGAITDQVKRIKVALFWLWNDLRLEGDNLRLDPTDDSIEWKMRDDANDFDENLKSQLAALSSGMLPAPQSHFDSQAESQVCQAG